MKKALKIIGIVLLASLFIYILVSFIINKEGTMYWINYFINVLNKPLPIVGLTVGGVLIFVWRVLVETKYGEQAINKYKLENEKTKRKYAELLEEKNKELKEERECNKQEINEIKSAFVEVCKTFPNIKINALGEKFEKELLEHGEEKVDSRSEKE